ncbi:hypothetical protein [Bacillus sp. S/N-304-OC-R1]|uniref:hypothetical protein n=1 Tax=Bacillus sp. S/N-304-OC-R1 TaxID=2758034 RepID=UPI001C8D54E0|nr:hypothetical protein [Bacillus sp. S/N-304-OC-R1]MBY0121669.1 hypothetical protein [Bacillus sp. S/N-304-OC-R1]
MFSFSPVVMNVLAIKVNAVDNESVVMTGSLQNVDLFLSYKRNQGIGEVNGDLCPLNVPISSVVDPDVLDSTSAKTSVI